jgi:DNA-binding SARP family transcriptional activator
VVAVRVLGALSAEVGGRPVDLGGPRQRGVLELLLVARGDVVSVDRLIEDLWRGEPPPRATGALQAYVSNLRRALEPDRPPRAPAQVLVSVPPGYAVRLGDADVDAWEFESLLRASTGDGDALAARARLERALGLWQGPAYAEVAAEPWAAAEAARLEELRLVARERLVAAMLRGGAAAEAVPEAEGLTREHPLREECWRLLALALYATGRQADALAALRRARTTLAEELGIDPGPVLAELEADVLAQRVDLPAARAAPPVPPTPAPAPASAAPAGPAPADPAPEPPQRPAAFVGRETELNALHVAARTARGGGAGPGVQVALVAGDPGAGKSALLEQFRRELAAGGWRVPVGRCPEAEGAPPAWAWVEALRELAAEVGPGPQASAVAPLLDDDARRRTGPDADAAFGRFRLHRAVVGWLASATDRPLAVFLDDLHRADDETLALLTSAADGVTGVPLMLVAAYRPEEVGDQLEETFAALARHAPTRLRLGGLDAAQAARVVRDVAGVQPDTLTLAALAERTGGNPFYLRESARLLASEGDLVAVSEVPEGVRDVLRRRFARLPEVTVAVLRLAAVLGREADVDVLVRAAEVDEETVLDALEAGVVSGLLTEPGPGVVRFTHVLVRETLYGDLSRIRRSRWHARVAAALESARPGDLAALAHHYAQAAAPATARRAVDTSLAAAARAEDRYADDVAATLYRQALGCLDLVPRAPGPEGDAEADDERVEILRRLMRAQLRNGGTQGAVDARRQALEIADRAGRPELALRALVAWDVTTPWLNRGYGRIDRYVVDRIERLLREHPVDDAERCRLLTVLVGEVSGEDDERAVMAAAEAVDLARRLDDPALLGPALKELGSVVLPDEEPERRHLIAAELLRLGERHRVPSLESLGHHWAMQTAAVNVDVDGIRRHLEAGRELAHRYRFGQAAITLQMTDAMLLHLEGRLDEAVERYLSVGEALRRTGAVDADGIVAMGVMTVRMTQGRLPELLPTLWQLLDTYPDVVTDPLALALAGEGRSREAREVLLPMRPIRRDFFQILFLTVRGLALAALGERAGAAEVYEALLPHRGKLAGAQTTAYVVGPVGRVLGDLAVLLDRPEEAAGHYAVAVELAERCGNEHWRRAAAEPLALLQADDVPAPSAPQADH